MDMKIYALLPAYNEEKKIKTVIQKLFSSGHIIPVVIDDGSTDATAEIAKKIGVTVIQHNENKGKGAAIRTGLRYLLSKTDAEYTAIIDTDMQYNPEEYGRLIKLLKENKADFVNGYRDFKKIPSRHRLGNLLWKWIFNFMFKTNLKDTSNGFVAMNKRTMKILVKGAYGGYIIDHALRIDCIRHNLRIEEVPVSVRYFRKSNVLRGIRMVIGVSLFTFIEGLKYRWIF